MRMVIMGMAALSLALPGISYAMNKCTTPEGKTVYQDLPCPSTAKKQEALKLQNSSGTSGGSGFKSSENPEIELINIKATLESMEVDGRSCEWVLKVYQTGPELSKCDPLIKHMKGPYIAVMTAYVELLKNNKESLAGRPELQIIDRASTNVLSSFKFLEERVKSRR